jgi:hypothetical protein
MRASFALFISYVSLDLSNAFLPSNCFRSRSIVPTINAKNNDKYTHLHMSNAFDVSKPVFDLLTLRQIRGDALLRYDSLNQSEPLRINLYGLLALTLFSAPFIAEAVAGENLSLVQTLISFASGGGAVGMFVRECGKRSKQLYRMEKELNAEFLTLRLPTNALADTSFGAPQTFGALRASLSPPRIVALCGTAVQLKQSLASLSIYGRRLKQASAYVVPIATDGSTIKDWGLTQTTKQSWLADAYETQTWLDYFDGLSEEQSSWNELRWFGLNSNGRSFASGSGQAPQWLEVLGQHLRPTILLDPDDSDAHALDADTVPILEAQKKFYAALTTGQLNDMTTIYTPEQSAFVTEVLEAGGRLDVWTSCLEDGARPAGMLTSGRDAVLVSETEAWSTVIEFPLGMDAATLLAVQHWVRASTKEPWKLRLHQTIPWTPDNRAQGTLRCDCRGCVALTRSVERRTFGGLIG